MSRTLTGGLAFLHTHALNLYPKRLLLSLVSFPCDVSLQLKGSIGPKITVRHWRCVEAAANRRRPLIIRLPLLPSCIWNQLDMSGTNKREHWCDSHVSLWCLFYCYGPSVDWGGKSHKGLPSPWVYTTVTPMISLHNLMNRQG